MDLTTQQTWETAKAEMSWAGAVRWGYVLSTTRLSAVEQWHLQYHCITDREIFFSSAQPSKIDYSLK